MQSSVLHANKDLSLDGDDHLLELKAEANQQGPETNQQSRLSFFEDQG